MKKINQTEERYASVLSDAGFKAVLGDPENKNLLINLLNIILRDKRVIKDIDYLNVEREPDVMGKKSIRMDLFCRDDEGYGVVIEMQQSPHSEYFFQRSLYYGASALRGQMESGDRVYKYKNVYVIGLMESVLHPESFVDGTLVDDHVIASFNLIDEEGPENIHGFPGISLIFVQLGLFNKKPQECKTLLDRCLYIFKHSEFLSEQPFEIEDGLVEKFLYACEVANFNEKKRITYFEDKMSEIDYRYEMDSERAEGRAEGLAQGRTEGEQAKAAEVAKAMLTKGMDPQIVAECTKLSFEQVEELKKSL